jgi:Glucose-6-phosphate isomerase
MLPKINPLTTAAWPLLKEHYEEMKHLSIKEFFMEDPERFKKYSMAAPDILFDFSKNLVNEKTMELLFQLAEQCELRAAIDAMFGAEKINETENRAVLHTALRNFSGKPVILDGEDIMPSVKKVLEQMKTFCEKVHNGEWLGYSGKKIKYIVNIGIGGSDLGPVMVTEALKPYWVEGIQTWFVSNVDGSHIAEVLKKITPGETIFLIASKTFTTLETMTNAHTAREWFLAEAMDESFIANTLSR